MIIEMDSQKVQPDLEIVYRIKAGDVWNVNLNKENGPFPEKHDRIGKIRPCVVLSCEGWNSSSGSNRVLILPLSTKEPIVNAGSINTNLGITIVSPRGGHLVVGYPCFNRIQTAHFSSFIEHRGQVCKSKWEQITSSFLTQILKYESTVKLLEKIEYLENEVKKLSDNRTTVILKDEFVVKLEEKITNLKEDNESKLQTIVNLRKTIENLNNCPDVILDEPDRTVYSTGPKDDTGFNSVIPTDMYNKLSQSIADKSYNQKDCHKKVISYNNGNKRISTEAVISNKTQSKLNTPNNRVYTSGKSCYKQSTYIPTSKETVKRTNSLINTDKEPTVALEIKIIEREKEETKVVNKEEPSKRKYNSGLNTRSIKNWTPKQAKDFIEYLEEPHTILETCKKFNIRAYATYIKLLPIITKLSRQK